MQAADMMSLGTGEDLQWLGDLCWNVGVILLSKVCAVSSGPDHQQPHAITDHELSKTESLLLSPDRLYSASNFLEYADYFYSYIDLDKSQSYQSTRTNQGVALVKSAAARLDACQNSASGGGIELSETSAENNTDSATTSSKAVYQLENMDRSLHDIRRARQLFILNGGFEDARLESHMKKTLILEFLNLCCRGPSCHQIDKTSTSAEVETKLEPIIIAKTVSNSGTTSLVKFYEENKDDLMRLDPTELKNCADVARKSLGGNLQVSRAILETAIQNCTREFCPNYQLIGTMYNDLISAAASREFALSKIDEFLQLLTLLANQGDDNIKLFSADDIDSVCSLSYNRGISSMQLEMSDFAEKFISKSLALLAYASSALDGWKR